MKKDCVDLWGKLDFDEAVFDADLFDSAREGVVTHAAGEASEEVLAFQLAEPGIWDRDTVDGEVIENDGGI